MSFFESIKDVWSKRKLITSLAVADFRKRFVGSYFGVAWMFVQPIVTILIYYIIFEKGFRQMPPVGDRYILWLVAGIVPWFFFNEAMNHTTSCLLEYSFLVKKVVFKISVLPLVKIISCIFVHFIFLGLAVVLFLIFGKTPSIYWIQTIYYTFALCVLTIGLAFITSSVIVLFRDMAQLVNIALQFGIWATPIMWDPSIFKEKAEAIEKILKINPVYYIVSGYRDSFLGNTAFWEKPEWTLYYWIFTIIVFVVGLKLFKKLKPHFADVL